MAFLKICFEQLLKVKKPQQSEQPHQFNPLPFRRRKKPLYRDFFFTKRSRSKPKTAPHDSNSNLGGTVRIYLWEEYRNLPSPQSRFIFLNSEDSPATLFPSIIFFADMGSSCGGVVSLFLIQITIWHRDFLFFKTEKYVWSSGQNARETNCFKECFIRFAVLQATFCEFFTGWLRKTSRV